jgi:hypothetical protein
VTVTLPLPISTYSSIGWSVSNWRFIWCLLVAEFQGVLGQGSGRRPSLVV